MLCDVSSTKGESAHTSSFEEICAEAKRGEIRSKDQLIRCSAFSSRNSFGSVRNGDDL